MFGKKTTPAAPAPAARTIPGFEHLPEDACYLDVACQTPRPTSVIDAEAHYYREYNACGGRVKYAWGKLVDRDTAATRASLLAIAGKSANDYAVVFTLNTTYGINLILEQLPATGLARIVTSDCEHNSAFLPTIVWAARHHLPRLVLPRAADGSLPATDDDLAQALVLVNATSNIDGRTLREAPALAERLHARGGLLFLDAAQTFAHDPDLLRHTDFDAAFGSGHKMYGPSIGFVIIKKSLLRRLDPLFVGGGTVQDVQKESFTMIDSDDELHLRAELGLQNWAGIIGLGAACTWLEEHAAAGHAHEAALAETLFQALRRLPRVHLVNAAAHPIQSFHVDGIDAHQLALYLSEQQIMCRSGTFCCHYYLQQVCHLPPLLRVSLGFHSTEGDIRHFLTALEGILRTF